MNSREHSSHYYASVAGHQMHIFTAGNSCGKKLVFLSGSSVISPAYDFRVLYEKLQDAYRIIVIEKFGYGSSDLYEGPCDIDSLVSFHREALSQTGETGPYILVPHSLGGLEAIRWKQLYPGEVSAIIGLDMAVPAVYLNWNSDETEKRIRTMQVLRRLSRYGLLHIYPLNTRGLDKTEIRYLKKLMRRNFMNRCFENEAREVMRNAETVSAAEMEPCPVLMFVSDGKQVSPGWKDHAAEFARQVHAETVQLDCGHFVHYYESALISRKIREFTEQ